MITGFNTDIEFQGVTYHVQTEDKGLETPLILSLVYDRGTILASKRSRYDDLLKEKFNEKELSERLQRQHKLICAAVRAGRIDDLKKMTQKESAAKRKDSAATVAAAKGTKEVAPGSENKSSESIKLPVSVEELPPVPQLLNSFSTNGDKKNSSQSFSLEKEKIGAFEEEVLEIPISVLEDLIIEEVQIIEENSIVLPVEAIQVVPEEESTNNEPIEDSLKIELLNDISFKAGERKTLSVLVKRDDAVTGAHVMVKILGSSFRPLIFHAKTDSNGVAVVQLQLPHFSRGRAAVLIRAMSNGEETELRRVIQQD